MLRYRSFFLAIAAFLLVFGASRAEARYLPQPCKNSYTPEREVQLGQKSKEQVYQQMPVLPDSDPIVRYVQALGAKLVEKAPGDKWPYEFHVVNQAEINAFALPGGPIFVNLGTIQAAGTEGQLAGVMAHEISHVALRHSTCNLTKQQTPRLLAGLGQIAAGVLLPGSTGTLAQTGIGAIAGFGFLKMSRDAEKQADLVGTDILYDSDYDPRAMPQFFEVIEGKYGAGGAQLLSDHPNPGNRVEYVQAEIESLPPKTHLVKNTTEFDRIHKLAAAMHAYSAQELQSGAWKKQQGARAPSSPSTAVSGEIKEGGHSVAFQPSGQWQTLDASQYTLSYPGNWQVSRSQDSSGATIAPKGGIIDGGNQAPSVTYGAVLDVYPPKAGESFEESFRRILSEVVSQNPGLQTAREAEAILVNKRPAKDIELTGPSALKAEGKSLVERDWMVLVQRADGSVGQIVFISPDKDFQQLKPTFIRMLQSFKEK